MVTAGCTHQRINGHSGTLDLVLQASNFHHRKGGPVEAIELGGLDDLRSGREMAISLREPEIGVCAHNP